MRNQQCVFVLFYITYTYTLNTCNILFIYTYYEIVFIYLYIYCFVFGLVLRLLHSVFLVTHTLTETEISNVKNNTQQIKI